MFPKTQTPAHRPARLLVVEDSPTDYLLLRKRLEPLPEESGAELLHADSLSEAIRQIELADAVILDLLLPDASDPKTNKLFCRILRPADRTLYKFARPDRLAQRADREEKSTE